MFDKKFLKVEEAMDGLEYWFNELRDNIALLQEDPFINLDQIIKGFAEVEACAEEVRVQAIRAIEEL